MKANISQKLFIFSFIVLLCIGILGYAVYDSNQQMAGSERWIHHTEQVIDESNDFLFVVNNIAISLNGLAITNDSSFRESINTNKRIAFRNIGRLKAMTADNQAQQLKIDSLGSYLSLLLRSGQGQPLGEKKITVRRNRIYIGEIQRMLQNIQQGENTLLKQRKQANQHALSVFKQFLAALFIAMATIVILLIVTVGKYLVQYREKERRAVQLLSYKHFFYNALDMACFIGLDGTFEEVSESFTTTLGYPTSEFKGKTAFNFLHPDDLQLTPDRLKALASKVEMINSVNRYRTLSGTYKFIEWNSIYNVETNKVFATGRDITEKINASKELSFQNQEKEKRASELVVANTELVFQNNEKASRAAELRIANTELIFQNQERENRAAELIVANKELLYQNREKAKRAAELVIANKELLFQNQEKEDRASELVLANTELLFQNNEKENRASELFIANEELFYQNTEKASRAAELVVANKELLFQNREKENRAIELDVANKELSFQIGEKEKRAEELNKSESRLKEAQAIAHVGNFEVNMIDFSEVWSDEMFKIYGVAKGTVTPSKQLFLSFIHPDDLAEVAMAMAACLTTFQSSASEFRFIRADGMLRYGYSEARFEVDKNQKATRTFGIFQDITDIKLAELERTKMLGDLMLRNQDLEEFAYIVSHNLRAPVANIIGISSALTEPGINEEDREMLNGCINQSITKLDGVVKDLNYILEATEKNIEVKEIVSLPMLFDDIKWSIRDIVREEDVSIIRDFSKANTFFTIKPYLYIIFHNLIANSVKYRRKNIKAHIEIRSRRQKNRLQITFKDNGIGIDLQKWGGDIFGMHKRFHSDTEGKGMGLFMVKKQVEALGGKITIFSKVNTGTEFKIEFEDEQSA